jgi:hypothetical protein
VYTFNFSLIVGNVEEIRETALALDAKVDHKRFDFTEDRKNFYYKDTTDKGFGNQDCLDFDFKDGVWLRSPYIFVPEGECKKILLDATIDGGEIEGTVDVYCFAETTRPMHENTPCHWMSVPFKLCGDGERRIHEIDTSAIKEPFVCTNIVFKTEGHAKIYSLEFKE